MSSLQISYSELRQEIGRFLGYGRAPSAWLSGSSEETDIESALRAGLRMFYWPPDAGGGERHAWSFLRKVGTVSTVSGTREYSLASDFGGILTGFAHATGTNYRRICRVDEDEIRSLYGADDRSGVPLYAALRTVQPSAGERTLYEVVLYPVPDAVYTLSYRYAIEPQDLDETNIYPLGGAVHSETILEACLAAAEKTLDPEDQPVHHGRFMERLQASIKIDREMQ